MKRLLVTAILALNLFVLCDVLLLSPQDSIVFNQQVRDRFSTLIPSIEKWLKEQDRPPVTRPPPATAPVPTNASMEPFVPPKLASLEELTQGWKRFPETAFPRKVAIHEEVKFGLDASQVSLPKGSEVWAISAHNGELVLAPSDISRARAYVSLEKTDFRAQIERSYADWSKAQTEAALKKWERRKLAAQVSDPVANHPGERPQQSPDGTYPILLASMAAGEVTEVTPKRIRHWGSPSLITSDGPPVWAVDVQYTAMAFCGPIDATARAEIRGGRVLRWIYPGSGEPVP
jgi:hypothetical protein